MPLLTTIPRDLQKRRKSYYIFFGIRINPLSVFIVIVIEPVPLIANQVIVKGILSDIIVFIQ